MSLISFRNFLAPFSSKFQIGALLVLAFLAFVIRYQAGLSDPDAVSSAARPPRVPSQEETLLLNEMKEQAGFGVGSKRRPPADSVLDDALAGNGPAGQPVAPIQHQPPPRTGGSLDDIRKSMGLE